MTLLSSRHCALLLSRCCDKLFQLILRCPRFVKKTCLSLKSWTASITCFLFWSCCTAHMAHSLTFSSFLRTSCVFRQLRTVLPALFPASANALLLGCTSLKQQQQQQLWTICSSSAVTPVWNYWIRTKNTQYSYGIARFLFLQLWE